MAKPLFSHVMNLRASDVLWRASPGGGLTPSNPATQVVIPGLTASGVDQAQVVFGTRTTGKGRLYALSTLDWVGLSKNRIWNGSTWAQEDASQPSWTMSLSHTDTFDVQRTASGGGGAGTGLLTVTNGGDLVINGNNATKATGTVWINPSDPRLKKRIAPYARGLAEIVKLAPITYQYNGLAGTADGQHGVGLDAEAVEAVFPECVQTRDVLLHPDDPAPTTIRVLDISAILFALITAIRELAARVPAGPPQPV